MAGTVACRGPRKLVKENSTIGAKITPDTPAPAQQGETVTMNLGFFGHITAGEVNRLSHVGINEFGKWARIRVEDHPEVEVHIEPDVDGYEELDLKPKTQVNIKQQPLDL